MIVTRMPTHSPSKTVILLADDDVSIRNMVTFILTKEGYAVLAAKDGPEALEISRRFSDTIHLLLADVVMPNMDGFVLAEIIRRDRPTIKVLLISGTMDKPILGSSFPDAFLSKPFFPATLLIAIHQVLEGLPPDTIEA
jgi:CheY-like chemotaxis protein